MIPQAQKRFGALAILILATIVLTAACGNNHQFDSATWLKSDARGRGRMAQNLVDSKSLLGKTVEDARQVLGPPGITYPSALQYKINLGWVFKDPNTYGLQVHLDEKR